MRTQDPRLSIVAGFLVWQPLYQRRHGGPLPRKEVAAPIVAAFAHFAAAASARLIPASVESTASVRLPRHGTVLYQSLSSLFEWGGAGAYSKTAKAWSSLFVLVTRSAWYEYLQLLRKHNSALQFDSYIFLQCCECELCNLCLPPEVQSLECVPRPPPWQDHSWKKFANLESL